MDARFQDAFGDIFGQQGANGQQAKPVDLSGVNHNHILAFVTRVMKAEDLTPPELARTLQIQVQQGYAVDSKTGKRTQLSIPQSTLYPHIVRWMVAHFNLQTR